MHVPSINLTTNLAACVCACAKCDPFLPSRSHFFFKRPEFFFRIAKFPYAAFGPLFAFHCPIFFTKNNLNIIELAMCVGVCVSHVLDSQLLNGWTYGHENCRVCSRTRSHVSVIFFVFVGLIFF